MVLCWATHGHSCCDCFVELLIAIAIITMAILVAHCFVDLPIGSALITMAGLLTVAFVELLLAIALLTMAFLVATSREREKRCTIPWRLAVLTTMSRIRKMPL